ncbi:hypothetical protein MSAN_02021100 [Mycena sanguinolenta]|uniref:Uncharacterized protein n=1 Tax=Mycena sanguinolenta TaxID=230812 RepID=A0A8H7CPD3_9AGAR|nr:hypothetical protein MSAN_02021100 [Mycena sanguinolenta]
MPSQKHRKGSKPAPRTLPKQCSTLLDDEMTRCSAPPTHGNPVERCGVHHEQYQTMTRRYKEAQKFVDETLVGALIPAKDEVLTYTSLPTVLEKARLVKNYVNAIREERTGREIHHTRFFLKVDDGHKIRLKLLAKQMVRAVEIRDALEARAMALHLENDPAKEWMHEFQTLSPEDEEDSNLDPITSYLHLSEKKWKIEAAINADDDLIALKLRFRREFYLKMLAVFIDPDNFWTDIERLDDHPPPPDTEDIRKLKKINNAAYAQYGRRIIFHDPNLFAKSLNKVSFKDLVMDDDFGIEDVKRILQMLGSRLTFGLTWWKDSLTEALYIKDSAEASANMGRVEHRVKILGGWIYKGSRNTPAPNKVWWTLLTSEEKQQDIENRYVRLCCNFDELHLFLTMSAYVMPAPSFCTTGNSENPSWDSHATRNHLSICGVIVTGMSNGSSQRLKHLGPMPTLTPAKRPGYKTWVEMEVRAYIFGALRDEPDDFTEAFLNELRARPDLFSVVTRSDTDPPRKLDSFGGVTDHARTRKFEAPTQLTRPTGSGEWEVLRSAFNVLYGGGADPYNKIPGYLSAKFNMGKDSKGRGEARGFFFHKRFPVKYFLILDASATSNVHDLARQVAWAAFRAHRLVQGDYDERKYDKASDVLFIKSARERLSFLPEGGYAVGNLASQS